jgi:hypothetical protein
MGDVPSGIDHVAGRREDALRQLGLAIAVGRGTGSLLGEVAGNIFERVCRVAQTQQNSVQMRDGFIERGAHLADFVFGIDSGHDGQVAVGEAVKHLTGLDNGICDDVGESPGHDHVDENDKQEQGNDDRLELVGEMFDAFLSV